MIYVTHDQVEAMTLADKIVVLSAGNVEQVGSPMELYHAPANLFVAGFIGSPKMNFGISARTMALESLGDAAYLYAESSVSPEGLIARIPPLERHTRGETLKLGATPEHCHLFDAAGKAFQRKIVEVLAA
jgi:multiple sugar transport system ATP-binding protein